MLNTADFTATQQANLDVLLGLSAKAFEGVEQITALNLQAAKASLGDAAEASHAVLAAKDPQSLLALQTSLMQGAAEKSAAYGKQVYAIATAGKADFEKFAAEQVAGLQSSFMAAVDAASKNAPEGSGSGVALFKSAIATANNAFDSLQKATRQATDAAEANFTAVSTSVTKAAKAKRG
ncbi:MAG: phasin family protein [Vitreoscilla sp.]|nr:phasin family protein [Vitreoscilla sp.]